MVAANAGSIEIRPYGPGDQPEMLALLQASLGWLPDDQYAAYFAWKHEENPFGASPAWVAVSDGRVVGLRTFMRWEFDRGGHHVRAVRAVDTATHPDYQGRGIFSRLTRSALEHLRAEGVAFVFNTPNSQSLPGYLKMGWLPVGKLAVFVRPRSLAVLPRLASARVPAERWATDTRVGLPAADVTAERESMATLLASQPARADGRLRTRRNPAYYAWRFGGFPALGYRAVLAGEGAEDGVVFFRLRRRGGALEAVIGETLVPGGDRRRIASLLRRVVQDTGADYGLRLGGGGALRAGFLPLPRQGPLLVWREVNEHELPPLDRWDLAMGDIELF